MSESGEAQSPLGLSPEELLERLREAAAVGRVIAKRRTTLASISRGLQIWVDLLETALTLAITQQAKAEAVLQIEHLHAGTATTFKDVSHHNWRCSPSALAEREFVAWIEADWPEAILQPPFEGDRGPALRILRRIVDATIDNLRAMALLLADGKTTRAPLALARIVLDGTAHAVFLLDLDVNSEERLVRTLNEWLSRAGEDYNAAVRSSDPEGQGRAEKAISDIFEAAGDRRRVSWNQKRLSTPFIGEAPVSTARMIRLMLEEGSIWNELSGVVHNKEDDGWRIMLGVVPDLQNPHRDSYVALYSFGAILGAVRLVELLEAYTEWDLSAVREMSLSLCLIWADASGLRDDAHRADIMAATNRLAAIEPTRRPRRPVKPPKRRKGRRH